MKKIIVVVVLLWSMAAATVAFAATGYPWKGHADPYSFLFGNHIDTHQQSQLNGANQLGGFFYITYTGNTVEGVPEAMHGDCSASPADCTAGWKLKGIAMQATLVAKPEMRHPVWCIDPAEMPRAPGYSHFHWLGMPHHAGDLTIGSTYNGYLLKLTAQDRFYFQHNGGTLVTPGVDTVTHANVIVGCDS